MTKSYDIIVTGGGIIGLAFACALHNTGLRIAVIEGAEPPASTTFTGYDLRVSAITRASQRFLAQIGAWDLMPPARIAAYQQMTVWDGCGKGQIEFDSRDVAEPELGFIIENRIIRQALLTVLKAQPHIDWLCPMKLTSMQREPLGVVVQTEQDEAIHGRLIVGADGANSWLRQQLQIKETSWGYGQQAIVTTVKTECAHEKTARQVFLATGPLAFLPLSDPYTSSIVWSSSEAERLMQLDDAAFTAELTQKFNARLGAVTLLDKRMSFPLRMRHAKHYVQESCALIGDAIHTIHPLAGQGMNLGLADAQCLAEVICATVAKHRDFGALLTLRRYERTRKGPNLAMIASMEGFKRLFSTGIKPVVNLRSIGLNCVNQVNPVKNYLVAQAMGLTRS